MDITSSNVVEYLQSADNDLLISIDHDDDKMVEVASLLAMASELICLASDIVDDTTDEHIASELIEDLASIASAFDASEDEMLIKKASVLDELLFSVAADKTLLLQNKIAATQKLKDLRDKFRSSKKELSTRQKLRKMNHSDEMEKRVESSGVLDADKRATPMRHALDARTCPDHAGTQLKHIDDGVWQCTLDEKIYNFKDGFTLYNGEKVSGGSIANTNILPNYEIPAWAQGTKI
jgi:hypothetical protein